MSNLYLIAHKVRNEPAFDIAIMLDVLDEDGDPIWIIPTSGHRAYPYWSHQLDLMGTSDNLGEFEPLAHMGVGEMPPTLPDHYACNDRPVRGEKQPSLLDRLNLKPVQPPIVRRI